MPWQDAPEHHCRNCEEQALAVAEATEVGKGNEEDMAMTLKPTLKKKVSNGLCRQLPFQLLYILCLLAYPHDVHTHSKTCRQIFAKADAKNTYHFSYYFIQRHHMGNTDPSSHIMAPVALTLAKLLLIYICVKISLVCSRKYSAQLGQFRHMK